MKPLVKTIKRIFFTFLCLLLLYIIGVFWAAFYVESISEMEIVEINKEIELNSIYDDDVFNQLLSVTNNEIKGSQLHSVYIKNDGSKTVYLFFEEYLFIHDFFLTDYIPIKAVEINYDNENQIVIGMSIQDGNSLLLRSAYMTDDTEWSKI